MSKFGSATPAAEKKRCACKKTKTRADVKKSTEAARTRFAKRGRKLACDR